MLILLKAWIQVIQRMPDQPLRLLLLGGSKNLADSNEEELKTYVKEHRLDSVVFIGLVSNVQDFLKAADVFTLPSLYEGMSLAVVEAMGCGLPVIVSDIIAFQDLVPSEQYGLIVPPPDSDALAEKLEMVFRDKEFGRLMGQRAFQRAQKLLSREKMLEKVSAVYDKVMAVENE